MKLFQSIASFLPITSAMYLQNCIPSYPSSSLATAIA
nr:MAG TPA: hypothetical protein [Caudoviricetes sp.]